jgi:chemosensory pili system protein ChpA (sensor histidine kinase/response regulator)
VNAAAENREALATLVDMAQEEISAALPDFDSSDSDAFRQLCITHLENILWVSELAGLAVLNATAGALQTSLADGALDMDADRARQLSNWLADVLLYIEVPDDDARVAALLGPLDDDARNALQALLDSGELGTDGQSPSAAEAANGDLEFTAPDAAQENSLPAASSPGTASSEPASCKGAAAENREALATLVYMAQEEISAALADFDSSDSDAFRQLCITHLDNILWVSEQAGLAVLNATAGALQAELGDEDLEMPADKARQVSNWLAEVLLYIETPDDDARVAALLGPLGDDARNALQVRLENGELGDEPLSTAKAASGEPGFPEANAEQGGETPAAPSLGFEGEEPAAFEDAASAFDDDPAPEFDTSDMLGMLASELYDVTAELAGLSQTIATAAAEADLRPAVDSYEELVSRVGTVARELGLEGLLQICEFVTSNLQLAAALPVGERAACRGLFAGWTRVVIDHLTQPRDDALCLAVVAYLEDSNWPQALQYREVRGLIEGLAHELEVSGDSEVEAREIVATPDDVSLSMSDDASPELVDAFFAESPGHAETFSQLMEAISRGEEIQQNVEAAQRIAHTLKGSGNLVGVRGIANLAHHIEDIFEYIARHEITPPAALAGTMQEAADTLEAMLESLQGIASPPEDAQRVLQDVLDWANRIDSGNMRHEDYEAAPSDAAMAEPQAEQGEDPPEDFVDRRKSPETEKVLAAAREEAVRVPLRVLDEIFRIVSETAITIGQIQERLNRLNINEKMIRKNDASLQQMRFELESLVSVRGMAARHRRELAQSNANFDPLELDEYDEFYGATHSYIEGVADSREILRAFSTEVYDLNALFLAQQRLNKELQQLVMATRMVPVSIICPRLQRAVRQACRATGKQVELTIIGQDLLLDGDVLNKLADPLMHMLRNAVDHSIEPGELRFERGKPESGEITLTFHQQGNNIVVDCCDDGKGLDYERIREVAIGKQMLSADEHPDKPTLAQMILRPGFSTSAKVTHVSGRGVGMDVVHNTIQSLNGTMDIGDAKQGGTRISLRLPITLLTSHCLLVGVGADQVYAIPSISLNQIMSPGSGTLTRYGETLGYQFADESYTACSLNTLVGAADDFTDKQLDACSVLLVQTPDSVSAVVVERVITSYDLVVKNMGAYIRSIDGIAGVAMLGNGTVVSVLDLASLLEADNRPAALADGGRTAISRTESPEVALPMVMIVDDSLSVRNSLSQLMKDGGYRTVTARDGLEAVKLLETEVPDIVLTDLEMPRMNGLDLTSFIRKSQQWAPLPVVMITSRTMAKHRQQAEIVGVNRYLTKPFSEDEVLASIDEQLSASFRVAEQAEKTVRPE